MPQDFEKSKPRKNNEPFNTNETDNAESRTPEKDAFFSDHTDVLARRDATQSHDYKGEAQNVNDDAGRPLNEDELEHARNKANEGLRQGNAGAGS